VAAGSGHSAPRSLTPEATERTLPGFAPILTHTAVKQQVNAVRRLRIGKRLRSAPRSDAGLAGGRRHTPAVPRIAVRWCPVSACGGGAHCAVDDHDGVTGPRGVAGIPHRLDPAVRGIIKAPAASGCPAEPADGSALFLRADRTRPRSASGAPRAGGDVHTDHAELFLEVHDPVVRIQSEELDVQSQQHGVPARDDGAQPVGQLPCTATPGLAILHVFLLPMARHPRGGQRPR
jgi:hypothetical protein